MERQCFATSNEGHTVLTTQKPRWVHPEDSSSILERTKQETDGS